MSDLCNDLRRDLLVIHLDRWVCCVHDLFCSNYRFAVITEMATREMGHVMLRNFSTNTQSLPGKQPVAGRTGTVAVAPRGDEPSGCFGDTF